MTQPASAAAKPQPGKRLRGWLVRVAVSAVVLVVLFQFVPVEQVWSAARRIPPLLWIGALSGFLLGHALSAAKWRWLIGDEVSFPLAFRAHLAGLAANLCLPGVAGGDVVRAGMVYRTVSDRARLAIGSVADRLLDTFGLLILALAGGLLALDAGGAPTRLIVLGLAGATAAAAVGLAAFAFLWPVIGRLVPGGRVGRVVAQVHGAVEALKRTPGRLAGCLALSMAVQAGFVGINVALATATGLAVPAAAWLFAWATAKIIAIAPVSLGGLGVREASLAGLLIPFGADPAQVVAVGLLWQAILYASGLLGIFAQLLWPPARPLQETPQPMNLERQT